MKLFGYQSKFSRVMESIFNLVLLHFLWMIFSLPIVTIGASTTALYSVTMKIVKNEESYIIKGFWKAFRSNFKQATRLWGILAGAVVWLLVTIRICMSSFLPVLKAIQLCNAGILLILILAILYVFPLQACYENTWQNTLKNSFYCALRFLPWSVLMAGVIFLPIMITGYLSQIFAVMIFFWLFMGSAVIACVNSFILKRVFEKIQ